MPSFATGRIAVIADAHCHDLFADYGLPDDRSETGGMAARLLADTARSTRVFNESLGAFRHALDDVVRRGIRHVVLLGDMSDDGQRVTMNSVGRLLADYTARHGLRFHATVGNHDIFAAAGRHRSKRFLNGDGSYTLATSDPRVRDPQARSVILSDGLYCDGYPDGLAALKDVGFFPRKGDLHWETPFGTDGAPDARLYAVSSPDGRTTRRLMDASYLVEPFEGTWLLMIDANVFVPVDGVVPGADGDFADSTGAGWNAMIRHKRFVLDWMTDVSARARHLGKRLLAFSHYPVLDPLDGTAADEISLLGRTGMSERIPQPDVAAALIQAGIGVHFSGHLHVNDTARHRGETGFLVNIAVPSLVAYPPAYKTIGIEGDRLSLETVDVGAMPVDPAIMGLYRAEIAATGLKVGGLKAGGMVAAETYGAFLSEHLGHLVGRRHLKREWPADLSALVKNLTLMDLAQLSALDEPCALSDVRSSLPAVPSPAEIAPVSEALAAIPVLDFLRDWYRLRMGSEMAFDWIPKARIDLYAAVSAGFRRGSWQDDACAQSIFSRIFRMFDAYAAGLPSRNFHVDLVTGTIERA